MRHALRNDPRLWASCLPIAAAAAAVAAAPAALVTAAAAVSDPTLLLAALSHAAPAARQQQHCFRQQLAQPQRLARCRAADTPLRHHLRPNGGTLTISLSPVTVAMAGGQRPEQQRPEQQRGEEAGDDPAEQQAQQPAQPAQQEQQAAPRASWLSGRNLALGGSAAAIAALFLFRREIGPVSAGALGAARLGRHGVQRGAAQRRRPSATLPASPDALCRCARLRPDSAAAPALPPPPQVLKWFIMQINTLTDKNVISEGVSPESLATGLAVALSL